MRTTWGIALGLWIALSGCGGAPPTSEPRPEQAAALQRAVAACRGFAHDALAAKADGGTQNALQIWCVDAQLARSNGSDSEVRSRRLNVIVTFTGDGAELSRFGFDVRAAHPVYTREGEPPSDAREIHGPVLLSELNELADIESVRSIAAIPEPQPG